VPTLADIVRRHGPEYVQRFGDRMSADPLRALRDIARCRTPVMGGHLWSCPRCRKEHLAFHSCGNRHCPACGADDARRWIDRQQALLLPVTYHLCTATVPEALRRPIRSHPRELLPLLFHAASSTLMDLCSNPKWLGAMPGVTAVLHTWTRAYEYHPHIHFLVTGGGVAPDGSWHESDRKFLVPVHALSAVFRARFRDGLRQRLPEVFAQVPASTWTQDWVVHSKPVGSGEQALRYLSRYLYRVALSNKAILSADAPSTGSGQITIRFRYRRGEDGKPRTCSLPPQEFLRRFLQHVLPKGFVKIRSYGLHHPSRRAALTLLRAFLHLQAGRPLPAPAPSPDARPHIPRCPCCHAPMRRLARLAPQYHTGHDPPTTGPPA
jgi:hypothetical protein